MSYLDDMIGNDREFESTVLRRDESDTCYMDLSNVDELEYFKSKNAIMFVVSSNDYDKSTFDEMLSYYRATLVDRELTCIVRDIENESVTVKAVFRRLNCTPRVGLSANGTYDGTHSEWSPLKFNGFVGYNFIGVIEIIVDDYKVKSFIENAVRDWNDYYVDEILVAYPD